MASAAIHVNPNTYVMQSPTAAALIAANPEFEGLEPWVIKTTTYTTIAGERVQTDTSGGTWTLTLPATATVGDSIQIEDAALTWATNNLTIARNGLKINSGTTNYTANVSGGKLSCVYISTAVGWSIK